MTEATIVTLHGPYDYREALVDDAMTAGAVAYNDKFEEVIIKVNSDWYFLEKDAANETEKGLFNVVKDDIVKNNAKNIANATVVVTVEGGGVTAYQYNAVPETPKTPAATKEEYLENQNFGEF